MVYLQSPSVFVSKAGRAEQDLRQDSATVDELLFGGSSHSRRRRRYDTQRIQGVPI